MAEVLLKRLNTRGIPAIQSIAVNTVGNVTTVTLCLGQICWRLLG